MEGREREGMGREEREGDLAYTTFRTLICAKFS